MMETVNQGYLNIDWHCRTSVDDSLFNGSYTVALYESSDVLSTNMTRIVIGLTGGIASGKSTVAQLLAQHGAHVIDTDQIAKNIVQRGSAYLAQIVLHFGRKVLLPNGQLDRAQLRQHIFQNTAKRRWLEALLHPAIRREVGLLISQLDGVIVVVIPLLRKRNTYPLNIIWTVEITQTLQIRRLMQRDQCNAVQANAIISTQPTCAQRRALSDQVIENHGTLITLQQRIDQLWRQLPR